MQEITASVHRKINLGNYENSDFMFSVKVQVLDGTDLAAEIKKLNETLELLANEKEKKIRAEKK